jgi:osmotically-inducible protein OsmY
MTQDSDLQQLVLAELSWEPSLMAGHIGVIAADGVITLSGSVENFAAKHAAETAALRVKGVKAVAEEIEVRLPFETERRDDEIAAAALERLSWNVATPDGAVVVKVQEGWLTLSGEVDWAYQREAAARDVRRLMGVVGVSNHISIRTRISSVNLSQSIKDALHRSRYFDPEAIEVTAEGGAITLCGQVHTTREREEAAVVAWSAPGATSVTNHIVVA